jgi:Uma2 family endonuclease
MATVVETKLLTAEEFMAADLGEGRFELVRGEIIPVPPTMPMHGRVCSKIVRILDTFGVQSGYGYCLSDSAVSTERGPDTVRGPDISFYSNARWPESRVGFVLPPLPPDLVVEVVSPSNRTGAILKKTLEYLEAGVPLIWIVHPRQRYVTVYRGGEAEPIVLREGDFLENLPELPGFRCPVADFFVPVEPLKAPDSP